MRFEPLWYVSNKKKTKEYRSHGAAIRSCDDSRHLVESPFLYIYTTRSILIEWVPFQYMQASKQASRFASKIPNRSNAKRGKCEEDINIHERNLSPVVGIGLSNLRHHNNKSSNGNKAMKTLFPRYPTTATKNATQASR